MRSRSVNSTTNRTELGQAALRRVREHLKLETSSNSIESLYEQRCIAMRRLEADDKRDAVLPSFQASDLACAASQASSAEARWAAVAR